MAEETLSEAERLALELDKRINERENQSYQESFVSLLTFHLGDEWFAIILDQVKVVSRMLEVTPVPGASPYVLGVINYKSAIYPLIDLHQMLGLPSTPPGRATRIIIINHERDSFAVMVDSMTEVKEVPASEVANNIQVNHDVTLFVGSELTVNGRLLGTLNIESIYKAVAGEPTPDTMSILMGM
jgi:purine-binding chemotaxis protein CheW